MNKVLLLIVLFVMAGCTTLPKSVNCKGKGTITVSGVAMAAYSGNTTLAADCGDGFVYESK